MTLIEIIRANPDATDAEIIAIAETPVYRSIPRSRAGNILSGSLDDLKAFANTPGLESFRRDILRLADGILTGDIATLDVADMPKVVALAGGAVAAGVLTQDQADALIAAGSSHVPFTPTTQDIADARAEIAAQDNRDALHNQLASRVSAAQAAIDGGTAATWQQVVDVIQGL